jgi:hypothetical protein
MRSSAVLFVERLTHKYEYTFSVCQVFVRGGWDERYYLSLRDGWPEVNGGVWLYDDNSLTHGPSPSTR